MKAVIPVASALVGTAAAGTVSFDLQRQPIQVQTAPYHTDLQIKAKASEVFLQVDDVRFIANVTLGTPPQMVPMTIDTGSSDIWVNSITNKACGTIQTCHGQFDFEASKTAKHLDKDELNGNDTFDARYSTGYIGANGTYVKDLMSWGGLEVKQQIFGLANNSNIDRNILGLSFNTSVGSISRQKPAPYPTFLDNLVDQGTINKRIFSLYLNVSKAETSSLLFGGVDKEKYYDGLVEVPMVPTFIQDVVNQYAIMMDGFVAKGIDGAKELKEKKLVILDNGSPFNLLPAEVIEPLEKHFGTVATNDGHVNGTYVNCDAAKNHDGVNFAFKFAGKTIYLPVEDIILDLYSKSQKRALQRTIGDAAANWNGVCVLAFQREYAGIPLLLGDPFLRNAYVVYDQDRETIALAQAKFNSSKSNIVEVAKNAGVPTKKGDATPKYIINGTAPSDNDKGDDNGNGDKGNGDKGSGDKGNGDKGNGKDDKGKDGKSSASDLRVPMAALLMTAAATVCLL